MHSMSLTQSDRYGSKSHIVSRLPDRIGIYCVIQAIFTQLSLLDYGVFYAPIGSQD
jgi:hypothetical protein